MGKKLYENSFRIKYELHNNLVFTVKMAKNKQKNWPDAADLKSTWYC